jgi:NitT/TauT family transport system permease protein
MSRITRQKGVLELLSIAIVLGIWELVAVFIVGKTFILPSFHEVATSFYDLRKDIPNDVVVSLKRFAIGLLWAAVVGIPIGAAMGWFKSMERMFDPIIQVIRPIPPIAWIPFALVWFHLTDYGAGFVVFIGALFPILINTYAGFKSVPRRLVETAQVLGRTKSLGLIRFVAFPYAAPSIFTGIRVSMGVGWMCIIAAEMIGFKSGLGFRLWQRFWFLHQMDNLMAYMILIGVVALVMDYIFRYLTQRRLLRWYKEI